MNSQPIFTHDIAPAVIGITADTNIDSPAGNPSPAASNQSPLPKAGFRTTQFWLLTGVLALVAWMVFAGRLDAGWFAALAPIAAIVYQSVRENLYRDASTHPHDALNEILETVLGQLPSPTSEDATAVIAAMRHTGPPSTAPASHLDSSPAPDSQTTPQKAPNPPLVAALAILGVTFLFLTGCAQTPYYVSGVNGSVDTSKDGSRITGGLVGVTISPNPYYPSTGTAKIRSLPKTQGLAK